MLCVEIQRWGAILSGAYPSINRAEKDTDKQEIILREVLQTRVEFEVGDHEQWYAVLRKFREENALFHLVHDPERSEHEYGVGGFRDETYRITDRSGHTYLVLRKRREWLTTSDDSTDYSEPRTFTILAFLPLMEELVAQLADAIVSMRAKAS